MRDTAECWPDYAASIRRDDFNPTSDPMAKQTTPTLAIAGEAEAPAPKPRMDPELQAMAKIDRILAEMPEDAAGRVFAWLAMKRFPSMTSMQITRPENKKAISPEGP